MTVRILHLHQSAAAEIGIVHTDQEGATWCGAQAYLHGDLPELQREDHRGSRRPSLSGNRKLGAGSLRDAQPRSAAGVICMRTGW